MNLKTLIVIAIALGFLNLAVFALKGTDLSQNGLQKNQNTVTLPIPLNHKGLTSATLSYNFTGKVVKVQPAGKDTRLILDISDPATPDFLIGENVPVFTTEVSPTQPTKITPDSIKVGSQVNIGMIYNLSTKTWAIVGVSVTPGFTLTPATPSSIPPPPPAKK